MMNKRLAVSLLALSGAVAAAIAAGADAKATPFKLGTFQNQGRTYVGLVLRDSVVIDVAAANTQYERAHSAAAKLRFPNDLKEIIARYDAEFAPRLRALAAENRSEEHTS